MTNVIKWLLKRKLAGFERTWRYDAAYLHEMVDADPAAAVVFAKVAGLGDYRKDVPVAVYFAARIVGTMAEDCGPCTQLTVDMAERAGVAPAVLRAITTGDVDAMPQEVALGFRFARAVLHHGPDAAALRADIVRRWGRRALVSLTFALLAARLAPTTKYALGHGHACTRLTIGGAVMPVRRELEPTA